jgi:stearoyl-CoA desaturase (delta-9 desaturase)
MPGWVVNLPFIGMHLACFAVLLTGVHPVDLVLCAACYIVRMFGITAGYHRYFAHRSYKTSRLVQFALAFLGCSALQKGPLWWAAHHRQHHRFSDTEDDPHSPIIRSIWWAHVGWVLSNDYEESDRRLVRDWNRYPELRWLDQWHWVPGIFLGVLCWLIDGWAGLVWGLFVSTVVLYHAVFTVNSLCHLLGRRRYATADRSRNNLFVAVITLGEGWHNNHHHYQSSANQGFFWYEMDLCYYVLRFMGLLHLVWGIRKPPQKVLKRGRAGQAESPAPLDFPEPVGVSIKPIPRAEPALTSVVG